MDIGFRSTHHPGCRVIRRGNEVHISGEGVYHYYFDNIPRSSLVHVQSFEYIASSESNTEFLGLIIHKLRPI